MTHSFPTRRSSDLLLSQFVEECGAADRVLTLEGDISRDDDRQRLVQAAIDRFGHVDILVNNAAVTPETFWPNFLTEGEPRQWTLGVEFYRNFLERSEEHTSELQSLLRISYAVFCLKKKNYT